jgi:hypothetical protein
MVAMEVKNRRGIFGLKTSVDYRVQIVTAAGRGSGESMIHFVLFKMAGLMHICKKA